ncbi:MAG TPA: hypothetical protein VGM32_06035 [Rhodopila sp.]|jgi:hypothetical protein
MAETSTAPHLVDQPKSTPAFFSNTFNPDVGPALKAQAALLIGTETIVSAWLHRRHEAALDMQQLIARLCSISNPLEAIKTQQEWVSRAFVRLAADTAACQSVADRLMDRARTWVPSGGASAESAASKGTGSAQGAGPTERTASDRARSAASRTEAMRPMPTANTTA